MYGILRRQFPESFAMVLTAIWYVALILLVAYFAFEPKAEFNYLNI